MPTSSKPVQITDVVLRDAHQSLLATRMRTEDMLPIADRLDQAGYWSLEMWGGATFDSMMRFLNEDPWERVRALRAALPGTRLQMLLRGQNVVGYRNYADDVLREFVRLAAKAGIDVFRVFDALNDPRNMAEAIAAVKDNGKWVEGTISYTKSPVHNAPAFLAYAGELVEMGAQSICIKDMAGLLDPNDAYELVSALKSAYPEVLVHMHSHYTSGMASMAYLKAVEAGADILDCAISSMSMGTSHPPTESMVAALAGTERTTGMDISVLEDISEYFREVRRKYGAYESAFTAVDPAVLLWQIPGGMISNLSSQLKEQGHLELMPDVLAEVPRVRKELGYPPLVTPTSQIVGTQATLNVVMGRYKMITKETKAYVQGLYGRAPGPIDPEVQKLCIGDEVPITTRPADLLKPELPKRRAELEESGIAFSEEDLVSYALFPQVALEFFARRDRTERPKEEVAALAAVMADLLGVQEEVCAPPEGVVMGAEARPASMVVAAEVPGGRTPGRSRWTCPYAASGPAWAAAGRRDLIAGRSVSWRY
ncbi:MAG: pyruvate carboxylase subunit B [Actinomycetia bacterium]|nr:pyruvate carboxylase subunit B [Actinomycetes bacterium]